MILSDLDIKEAIKDKRVIIDPEPEEEQYTSSSLDLRVDEEFKEYNKDLVAQDSTQVHINFSKLNFKQFAAPYLTDLKPESDGSIIIKPGAFVLAQTLEKISLPVEHRIAARVEGRSSCARLGLTIHLSAPTIHAGFSGKITLEIINQGPLFIRLDPKKDKICQLIFEQLSGRPSKGNISSFQEQVSVTGKSAKTQ